jgi:hypothetical protein
MAEYVKAPKHALNHTKLILQAPCPTAEGKYSQLKFDVYMNNPRIVVRTNDPTEQEASKGFGMINANMETPTFYAFLELLKKSINSDKEDKDKISIYTGEYVDRKPTGKQIHVSDIWIGRDKEGQIFISVISKKDERPVIKFIFGPPDERFVGVSHSNGTPYTKAEMSVLFAKSYVSMLGELMAGVLVNEYVEPPPREQTDFNKGAGYTNNAPYPSKVQQKEKVDIVELDLPF